MVLSILFAFHRNRAFPQLSSISKRGLSSRSRRSRARGWIPAVRSKVVVVLGVPSFLEAQFANCRLGDGRLPSVARWSRLKWLSGYLAAVPQEAPDPTVAVAGRPDAQGATHPLGGRAGGNQCRCPLHERSRLRTLPLRTAVQSPPALTRSAQSRTAVSSSMLKNRFAGHAREEQIEPNGFQGRFRGAR